MSKEDQIEPNEHISVLAETLLEQVHIPRDGIIVDATVGQGGHSFLFGKKMGPDGIILGLDVDESSIKGAHQKLDDLECRIVLVRENFAELARVARDNNIEKVDLILADLGFCSAQLNDPGRGLSFQQNMPLDMRLDNRVKITASDIVNNTDEEALANIIFQYGEERASRKIAREIAEYRRGRPITMTGQLATIVCRALNKSPVNRKSKIHPATKTFQALRIAVNDELGSLERLLTTAPDLLKENGFIAIISFHSLEDRIVKNDFKRNGIDGIYTVVTKKPITAANDEIESNPRARSAKLRIAQRKPDCSMKKEFLA